MGTKGTKGWSKPSSERGYSSTVPRFGYRRNTQSIDSAVEGLRREGGKVRGVVLVATYRAAADFIRQIREVDSQIVFAGLSFVGSNAFAQELFEMGPAFAEGVIVSQVVPHFESSLPGVVRYRELLSKFYPAERPGFVSLEGYLAARILVESLEKADPELSGLSIVFGAESLESLDLGIGTEVGFGPRRHQGSRAVWGTVLDRSGEYRPLELPAPAELAPSGARE